MECIAIFAGQQMQDACAYFAGQQMNWGNGALLREEPPLLQLKIEFSQGIDVGKQLMLGKCTLGKHRDVGKMHFGGKYQNFGKMESGRINE